MKRLSRVHLPLGPHLQRSQRARSILECAGPSIRPASTRYAQARAQSSLPGPSATKKTREIPFPSYGALKFCIPIAIGSMFLYVYMLEPYKYKGPQSLPMRQDRFASCPVVRKEDVSQTSSIFTFRHGKMRGFNPLDLWRSGTWTVEVKQPNLQISRFYTPLPPVDAGGRIEYDYNEQITMRLLVRREQNGEVSNYLHSLPANARIEVRGPFPEFELPRDVTEVVFIAGGTGIAPAIQIAYALGTRKVAVNEVSKQPKMSILWASRTMDDAFGPSNAPLDVREMTPVRQLEKIARLKYNDVGVDLTTTQFVDESKKFIQKSDIERAFKSSSTEAGVTSLGRKLVLVSGPEGFVQYIAGPKTLQNGQEGQGPVRGLLGQLDLKGWEVSKL